MKLPNLNECKIAIIGLGYVGLPLAIEFSKSRDCFLTGSKLNRKVIGFDISESRIHELINGFDKTKEIYTEDLNENKNIFFSCNQKDLIDADVYIVTVPTPINDSNQPDLQPLKKATKFIGRLLKDKVKTKNDTIPIIIYESTVYPGATEEICIPIIEKESGRNVNDLNSKTGFLCGYSPERINPGDKDHRLTNIVKVTSGSNIEASIWIDNLYGSIIKAGTHKATSIKVAEASKVIENTQRDLNIALINELSIIFRLLKIDSQEVLEAASTKWNFLKFKPGLVGGHCIGVDPYYLTYRSEKAGYYPQVVLAGRRINNGMAKWIAQEIVKEMCKSNITIGGSSILICGVTFKENCPDIRNTKVIDLINVLKEYNINISIVDPLVNKKEFYSLYDLQLENQIPKEETFNAIVVSVAHNEFISTSKSKWESMLKDKGLIFDIKSILPKSKKIIRI